MDLQFTGRGGGDVLEQKWFHNFFFDWVLTTIKTFDLGLKLPFYLLWKVSGGGGGGGVPMNITSA